MDCPRTKKIKLFFAVTKSFIVIKILHNFEFFYNSRTNPWNKKFHEKKKMKKKKEIKDIIIRDIRSLFKEEDYYKPKRVSYFWNNNYI